MAQKNCPGMELHSIGSNTKSVSRTKGGAEVKTKPKNKRVKANWEKALEHYEAFDYEQGEVQSYCWNEQCPRCGRETKILCNAPYCLHCNWDSLDDENYSENL